MANFGTKYIHNRNSTCPLLLALKILKILARGILGFYKWSLIQWTFFNDTSLKIEEFLSFKTILTIQVRHPALRIYGRSKI